MILGNEKNIHLMWRQSLERVSSAERDNARIFSNSRENESKLESQTTTRVCGAQTPDLSTEAER